MDIQREENQIISFINQQKWLDRIFQPLQDLSMALIEKTGEIGRFSRNFLNGIWLGHPLHPVITDIPVGGFTAAMMFDLLESQTGEKAFGKGADAALVLGVGGAAGAAVTGLTDWTYTDGESRRVGILHALLNVTSLGFYILSLVFRINNNRTMGRSTAAIGYIFTVAAAYLGGDLVFRQKIGVNHAPEEKIGNEYKSVWDDSSTLKEGQLQRVDFNGEKILLTRRGDSIYALTETCAHQGGPLSEGKLLDNNSIVCPWPRLSFRYCYGVRVGWTFSLSTAVLPGPCSEWPDSNPTV